MAEHSGRTRTLVLAVAASAAVVAVTVLFANVNSTSRVTDNAGRLHHVNATLGTAAVARAAAGQAALFDELAARGLASPDDVRVARSELEEASNALRELAEDAPDPVAGDLEALLAALSREPLDREEVEEAYGPAAERLRERIADLEEEIERSERFGNYMSAGIRLLVVLIIPASAIIFYRRRAADQLREERVKMEALLEAEREINRAKDRFVAGMSHEMRTPLTGICGFTELLLDTPEDVPLERDIVEVIHSEATELSRMVDDFIVTSRIEGDTLEVELEEADLAGLARAAVARFERRGIPLEVEGGGTPAICDRRRTDQILTNLVSNAVRHGGPTIEIEVHQEEATVRCRVSDDGAGIPSDVEPRLFTRFVYDGDEALTTGSLGLGTWVARELARAMGGDVTHRREGDSTLFELTLPAAPTSDAPVEAPVEAGARM